MGMTHADSSFILFDGTKLCERRYYLRTSSIVVWAFLSCRWAGGGRGEEGNGKLGTYSEGFPQYNKLGSVRHECELQGVMTS